METSEKIRLDLKKLKDSGGINFTDKNNYSPILKQMASDYKVDRTTVYKQMKKVAKEKGDIVGKPEKKTEIKKDKNTNFNFSSSKSTVHQNQLLKQKQELENKKKQMQQEIEMQNMIVKSPAFEMMKTSNFYTLSMFRELIIACGGKVAEEKHYQNVSAMMAVKELRSGWQIPSILENVMLGVGLVGLIVIPLIPQIRKWLNEEDEKDEKKSDEKLSDDGSPDLKNGNKKEGEKIEQKKP